MMSNQKKLFYFCTYGAVLSNMQCITNICLL